MMSNRMGWNAAGLVFGVFACSTAVLVIKESEVPPILLSALRLLLASLLLLPLYLRARARARPEDPSARPGLLVTGKRLPAWQWLGVPAVLLAVHFASWNLGARMTLAANGSLIVNLVPLVMPFFMLWLGEGIHRRELAGTLTGLAGVALLVGSDYVLEPEYLIGDLVCFLSMTLFAAYLAWGRRIRYTGSVWLYVVPVYFVSGSLCLLASLVLGDYPWLLPLHEWGWMLYLAAVPTLIGHTLLNFSLRTFRGQTVSVVNLGQFIFAGTAAWMIFSEIPLWTFFPAAALTIGGAILVLRGRNA